MPTLLIRLEDDTHHLNRRPTYCPYCGNQVLQKWGQVIREVQDARSRSTEIHRYRCEKCEHTFRVYPRGVDRLGQTRRLRDMAALARVLGMSCRDVTDLFEKMGIRMSRMTVWRGGQQLIEKLANLDKLDTLNRYHLDKNFIPRVSSHLGIVIVFELEPGNSTVLGIIDEYNPREVMHWLNELIDVQEISVRLLDTNTLNEKYVLATAA
jgi:transposase-like protein